MQSIGLLFSELAKNSVQHGKSSIIRCNFFLSEAGVYLIFYDGTSFYKSPEIKSALETITPETYREIIPSSRTPPGNGGMRVLSTRIIPQNRYVDIEKGILHLFMPREE